MNPEEVKKFAAILKTSVERGHYKNAVGSAFLLLTGVALNLARLTQATAPDRPDPSTF